jgi:CBS domain-containing protein
MGLQQNLRLEPVSKLALRQPVVVTSASPLREAIVAMRERRLGCAVVVNAEQKPIGMFTEGMLTKLLAAEASFLDDPIERHMTGQWPCVRLSDPIIEVVRAMELKNTRFLCVIDDEGRLAGLTGQKGLMEYIAEHYPEQVMVQRIGGKPNSQTREGA